MTESTTQKPNILNRRQALASWGAAAISAQGLYGLFASAATAQQSSGTAVPSWLGDNRIRRVVTGVNAEGQSCILNDEMVTLSDVWDTTSDQPLGAAAEPARKIALTGKTKLFFASIPPSKDPKPTLANRIGFRPTQGIAYCLLLSGEICLLVDLQEITLRTGDVLVERMAAHSWRNEGSVPVSMLIVRIEA